MDWLEEAKTYLEKDIACSVRHEEFVAYGELGQLAVLIGILEELRKINEREDGRDAYEDAQEQLACDRWAR